MQRARQKHQTDALARWYSKKYNLPEYDPTYLARPQADHMVEQYADLFLRRDEAIAMLQDISRKRSPDIATQKAQNTQRRALMDRINAYNDALGEPAYDDDPVASAWDKEIAAGRVPDFGRRR